MASIEDRWFTTITGPDGKPAKVPTPRNGTGKRWRAHYRTPAGQQRNRSFDRKADADRYITSVEGSKLAGTYVDPARARITVGDLAEKWFASKLGVKASTRQRYRSALDVHVLPKWKDVTLAQLEHEDIQAWVNGLGGSAAQVRKIHGVLYGILQLAVRGRRLPFNPADDIELPRAGRRQKKYLTAGQVETMAAAAAELPAGRPRMATDASYTQYRLVVLVLAYCGLRWSELAALRVADVDLLRRRVTVRAAVVEVDKLGLVWGTPKSHEARWISVPRSIADELAAHVAGKQPGDLLFTSPDGGVLRNRNARRAWFNTAAIAAGAPGLTPHELRHTAASLAVKAGANVKALQRMLGHASAAMTLDVYADLFDDDLEAVADRLDAVRAAARVAPPLPRGQVRDLNRAR